MIRIRILYFDFFFRVESPVTNHPVELRFLLFVEVIKYGKQKCITSSKNERKIFYTYIKIN